MAKVEIIDDEYDELDVDTQRVQAKPTMYISYTGEAGVQHLGQEIANNIIDEHINPNSISDGTASIYYDAQENIISFKDTGRGIPFNMLESSCTILHTGSKMNRTYGSSAGENGVGLTVTNALSELFEITSTRDGKAKFLQFKEGVKTADKEIVVKDKSKHGLLVSFKPSTTFLGKDARLPVESFTKWLEEQSFFLPKDLEITFTCEGLPGKAATVKRVFKNTKGIVGYLENKSDSPKLLSKPIYFDKHMDVVEEDVPVKQDDGSFKLQSLPREINLHVAFNFDPKKTEPSIDAFCNNIKNIDGGRHQDAVRNAIASFFLKQVTTTNKKSDKIEYQQSDVLSGIDAVLNMETTVSTKFESQTKHRLGNEYFYKPVRQMTVQALEDMFKLPENKSILNKITNYVKFNAKLRLEQNNKRSKVATTTSFMDSKLITGYIPPNLIGSCYDEGVDLEIYIVEGDSPGGQVRKARRSNDLQGVLKLRGKPKKIYDLPPSYLDQHPNDMNAILLRDVLGCGWGRHFSIEHLRYKMIIISSDADIDGTHISTILLANIYRAAPELITGGYVYRVIFPLYKIHDKAVKKKNGKTEIKPELYLYSKNELYDRFEKMVSSKFTLKFEESDKDFVSISNIRRFLSTNREYYEIIHSMSGYMTHPDVIEFVAANLDTFKTRLKELDDELEYDEPDGEIGEIGGCYNKEYCALTLDEMTMAKLEYLSKVISVGNEGITHYEVYEKISNGGLDHLGRMSIYQIMNMAQKYFPELDARYKGLGELEEDEMQALAMDPANRVLVQFTVADAEKLMTTLDSLFLTNRSNDRKAMLKDASISIDDIDN